MAMSKLGVLLGLVLKPRGTKQFEGSPVSLRASGLGAVKTS